MDLITKPGCEYPVYIKLYPFCGVVKKFADEFKAKEKRIEKEKEAIELKYNNPDNELLKLYDIRRVIEQYFNVDIDLKTNKRDIAYARQMAMYYARELTRLTLSEIGSRIAGRDHATVLHAVRTISNLKRYPETEKHISELNKIFNIK